MPYGIRQKAGTSDTFQVINKETGRVLNKGASKSECEAQIRALGANVNDDASKLNRPTIVPHG